MPFVNEQVFHRFQQDAITLFAYAEAIATKFEMNLDDCVRATSFRLSMVQGLFLLKIYKQSIESWYSDDRCCCCWWWKIDLAEEKR